ncbi:nitrogen regulation protein NR(II) [Agarilytica rhodophyticola]|uniref:nitrogen regulation protein NR(II) n=1 Tax=Agarilytica rhodophyticola TaxID=1737490 RepID=UPI000B34949B|nr:nitrogen regulation protein NR(II) [Agarilytica rhodophyticola]
MVEQASYKQILDSLTTAVIVLDYQLKVSYLNASAESLMGISSEHLVGKSIEVCFGVKDGTPKSLQEALEENRHFTRRQVCWKLHNQQEVTLDYTVTPTPEIGYITVEIQPLDRLLRISREEAWISSQETSRNLVRSMAHEIKNPLGGIRGAAQLLSRELGDSQLEEYTRIIIDETDRLRNLVDRMLGPRTPPDMESLNIHEVLEHVVSVVRMEVQGNVEIKRDYDPSIPNIEGDKTQLVQAFLNIVRNAIQALTENQEQQDPNVIITTRIKLRYTIGRINYPLVVKVSITDNGPGISKDIVGDIFFPMITGRAEGSGLGLSIAQNLIGRHYGLIECNSETGHTEFAVYIPLGKRHA